MQSIEAGSSILTSFSERGFSIAIDDFGTGYSSLTYLTNLPSEKIKFDRSFVTGLKRDTDAYHVMNAMINLCHKLGKRVIAEGVEQLSQSELLKELGCDEVQGFFYARPAPLGDIAQLLTRIQRQVPEIRIEG